MANLALRPHLLTLVKFGKVPNATCFNQHNKGIHSLKQMTTLGSHGFCKHVTRNSPQVLPSSQTSALQIEPVFHTSTEIQELENRLTYLFRTNIGGGGQVKVYVGRKDEKHVVHIQASSLPRPRNESNLVLSWAVIPFDSSLARFPTRNTPFIQNSAGVFVVEMEFESNQTPFYLSFLLHFPPIAASSNIDIKSDRNTNFRVPVGIRPGNPHPLGISYAIDGSVNFSLFSRNATSVSLCLYDGMTQKPSLEIDLDPYINRTGDIWHVQVESALPYVSYGYRCDGEGDIFDGARVLLDPYAKILCSSLTDHPESVSLTNCLGSLLEEPAFDWSGDVCPCLSLQSLIIYRLNVELFTSDKSSKLPAQVSGTFSGLVVKLDHFKGLGVNAVLLEPVFPFDVKKGPYFPFHFFSPMNSYGSNHDGVSAIKSMKEMVKTFHANKMEVLLEVVFNRTAEGRDSDSQITGLRGIDDVSYYGNAKNEISRIGVLNCNNPVVQQLVLDSLRHWVTEFHIDGFCFVNASALLRGSNGEYLSRPPLVEAISFDPILSKAKIISDSWDPYDMVPKDIQFPHWKRWAEINTKFCYDVRNFLRGEGLLSHLATRLCGSGDIFLNGRSPAYSFNFIARNFGLPLVDLVSFSENNLSTELSWNCGEEGATNKSVVLERRLKQIRNFLFILYISLGVPVLNMGDECGQSCGGSPLYNDRSSLDWDALKTSFGLQVTQFISFLTSLRVRRGDLLQRKKFVEEENIDWHGSNQTQPRWEDPSSKFLAMILKVNQESTSKSSHDGGDLFLAFNAGDLSESVILPLPSEGMTWFRLVDTALPYPDFFLAEGEPVTEQLGLLEYEMKSHSCALFEAQSLLG